MSPPRAATERYDPSRHDASQFQSGNQALDRWLVRYAGQSERRDVARTFVVTDAGVVIGYYALLACELDHGHATERARKGMSRHCAIPVAILARLAVDRQCQNRDGISDSQILRRIPGDWAQKPRLCRSASGLVIGASG